ncbi:hypothetical protein Vadar_004236 [Vaccinium darrowii]|uniref:Uncharacterized protein n=1 Tax=Vaccinium darrowii TaxID=229202 RepID=A0ACB7ZI35_9ERIC|nr:hypothetical protein Vadar_004236 [Vaccinium darrowii]
MSLPTPADRPSELFTWEIENFSKLNTKLYSEIFYCGGYKWRVLIFLKANKGEYLSAYLAVADSAKLPRGWSRYARFSISVINKIDNEATVTEPVVTVPYFHDSKTDTGFEPTKTKNNKETGDNSSGNVEADITGTPPPSTLQSIMGSQINFVDASSEATATAGKVRFLSCWVSSEAFLLLEKIHRVHNGTFVKFSMKVQALQTVLLESFASFIVSMSSSKVNDMSEEALRLAAISIEDFEQVGLDLWWLKKRLGEAKTVKKYSESVNTVDSCGSALEVARGDLQVARCALEVALAKVRELEKGLAKAKAEVEVMSSSELLKSVGLNDFVLKDIV